MIALRILIALMPSIFVILIFVVGKPFLVFISIALLIFATWLFFDVSKIFFEDKR